MGIEKIIKKDNFRTRNSIRDIVKRATIPIVVGVVVVGMYHFVKRHVDYNVAYERTMMYADKNNDSIITPEEKRELCSEILKAHGAILKHCPDEDFGIREDIYHAVYPNGERVPIEILTEWLRNYKP